ncbi:hypothetical protein ABPG74_010366 [Tetrahymena malaccensis]
MKKECIEIKIKGKTQSVDHILYNYDRIYHEKRQLKVPLPFFYDQFASDKVLDNILIYMDNDYANFQKSITSVGYLKNDLQYFQNTAFSNNIMNKFLVCSENRQFTEFFQTYNEANKEELNGFNINCAMIEYSYIQQKVAFEKKQKENNPQTSSTSYPNQLNKNIKEKCDSIREELSVICDKINIMNMRMQSDQQLRKQESNQYKQRKKRLQAQLKQEDELNKKLVRMIHEISAQKKVLEQQKQNLLKNFSEELQKEVQKKLKDYQDMLRAKHKDEILKLEQTYNFDLAKRKKITQDLSELKNESQSMEHTIENSKKIVNDILIKQREKLAEIQEIKTKVNELDQQYQMLCSQSDQQNDILNCKLCQERPAQIIFRPCGHLIYCESCWIDYLTEERDPYVNQAKYMCLACREFRNVCKIEGFSELKE